MSEWGHNLYTIPYRPCPVGHYTLRKVQNINNLSVWRQASKFWKSSSTGKRNLNHLHVEKQSTGLPSSRLFETEIMQCSTGREEQLQKHVPVDVGQRPLTTTASARHSLEKNGLQDSVISHEKHACYSWHFAIDKHASEYHLSACLD